MFFIIIFCYQKYFLLPLSCLLKQSPEHIQQPASSGWALPQCRGPKTTAQTSVAYLLAVVDFRVSQQTGTRQTESQGRRGKEELALEPLGSGAGRTHLEAARGEQ